MENTLANIDEVLDKAIYQISAKKQTESSVESDCTPKISRNSAIGLPTGLKSPKDSDYGDMIF